MPRARERGGHLGGAERRVVLGAAGGVDAARAAAKALAAAAPNSTRLVGQDRVHARPRRAAPSTRSSAAPRWCPTRRWPPGRSASGPRWRRAAARVGPASRRSSSTAWNSTSATDWSHCVTAMRAARGQHVGELAGRLGVHRAVGEQPGHPHLHERPGPLGVERRRAGRPSAGPAPRRAPRAAARSGRSGRCRPARGPAPCG